MKKTNKQILIGAGLLLTGLILGWLLFSGPAGHDAHTDHDQLSPEEIEQHIQEAHTDEQGEIIYTCSMHPSVRENEPGNCPICGMELIPVSADVAATNEDAYSMVMTEAAVRLADIQTVPVIRDIPGRDIDMPGRIKVDERRISYVTTHFEGRIRDVKIDFIGAPIQQGEPMATIYSPELISAQRELLEAARQKDRNPRMYESVRQKFRLWEFTDEQINQIEELGEVQTEMEILSPVNGFVLKRDVVDEQHVMEGTVIYEVVNLDQLWVVLEAYEEDIDWITIGDPIQFRSRNNPGQNFEASVTYIDPVVDPGSRTTGIRADFQNHDNRLKPDMLVRGSIRAEMDSEKLMVPVSSVLWTGPRSLVYVKDTTADVPRFEVREVDLGVRAGNYYVIEEGVEEGEEVVFHGAFRIDSEMQLADRFSMMNREPGSGAVPVHDHGQINGSDHDHVDYIEELPHDHNEVIDGVTEDFQQDFSGLIHHYLEGKEAMFTSDSEAVRKAFQRAREELESIGFHRMESDAHMRWMEQYETIENHLNHITGAYDIEEQREGFRGLSNVMIEVINNYAISGVIYHQYCPMADASWLSSKEQIQNPYSPDAMPSCGEVIERIE